LERPEKDLMTIANYHTHTKWSDGSATVQEMIEAARKAGFDEFGVSDHFALTPGDPVAWAIAPESLGAYVAEVLQAKEQNRDIRIRLGLEVDYYPETIEQVKERLASHPFDFLIGSVHFVDSFPIDLNAQPWRGITQESRDHIWRSYWRLLRATAQCGIFDIVGHFDLPKKFNFFPSADLTDDACSALDAIAAADMAIEINTSGWDKPVAEAYPSLFYLQEAHRRKIQLVISSDAHAAGEVARHFERAQRLAAAAGYTKLARFDRRRRSCSPL
jgi:histidinol-phosphatase (PHP family)